MDVAQLAGNLGSGLASIQRSNRIESFNKRPDWMFPHGSPQRLQR